MNRQQFIASNEAIVYEPQISPARFIRPLVYLLIGIICYFFIHEEDARLLLGIAFGFLAIFRLLAGLLYILSTKYFLTNTRLIVLDGLLARRTTEIILMKCEGITYDQGIVGRLFNYGTIKATTGGVRNSFDYIKAPQELRQKINEQIDHVQQ